MNLLRRCLPALVLSALLGCPSQPPPPAPAPAPAPEAPAVVDAGPPDAGPPDAGEADAGPSADAGLPDVGEPDAGPPDAGPPDAGRAEAPKAETPKAEAPKAAHPAPAKEATEQEDLDAAAAALKPRVLRCLREAEKLHWGPQRVVIEATLAAEGGSGVLSDGKVSEGTLKDAHSQACFESAMAATRFPTPTGGLGKTLRIPYNHVPRAR